MLHVVGKWFEEMVASCVLWVAGVKGILSRVGVRALRATPRAYLAIPELGGRSWRIPGKRRLRHERGTPHTLRPTRRGPPALFSDQAFRLGGKAKPTGGRIAHLWRSAVGSMALDPLHLHAWPFLHPGPSSALLCLFPDPSPGHLLPFLQGILFSCCPAPSSSLHLLFQNTYIYSVFQTIQPLLYF